MATARFFPDDRTVMIEFTVLTIAVGLWATAFFHPLPADAEA